MGSELEFTIVSRDAAPKPYMPPSGVWARIYAALAEIERGGAMKLSVRDLKQGRTATKSLRKIANDNGDILGMSRDPEGKNFYFWLEPK